MTTTTTTCSTTTTVQPEQLENLLTEYEQIVNIQWTPFIRSRIIYWLTNGLTYEDLDYALIQTGGAPRPAWNYTEAILRRIAGEKSGVVSPMRKSTAPMTRPIKTVREQCYTQREYTNSTGMPDWMRARLEQEKASL